MIAPLIKILNYIALDDFGGLQSLYCAFINSVDSSKVECVTVNRAVNPPLAVYVQQLSGSRIISGPQPLFGASRVLGNVASLRTFSKRLHEHRVRRYLKRENIDKVVLWSALPDARLFDQASDLIVYDHGLSWLKSPNEGSRRQMKRASRFICVSNAAKRMLLEVWDVKSRIDVIGNPLRFRISPETLHFNRTYDMKRGFVLGCAARMISFKGLASAINAVALLRRRGFPARLRLAGAGPDEADLRNLTMRLDIADHVDFVGLVLDMQEFYRGIDVFVCPSLREPYGLVLLEALACGVPIIISNVDGMPEAMPTADAGIILEPKISVKEYVKMGGNATKMVRRVYHPTSDKIGPPLALDPSDIADAVCKIAEQYVSFAEKAKFAGELVRRNNDLNLYSRKLEDILVR